MVFPMKYAGFLYWMWQSTIFLSKHVAGSISEGVMCLTLNVVPLSKQIWPKTWLLNFWAATGVPPLINESLGLNLAIEHIGFFLKARSSGTSYLSHTALAQTHCFSSMASSWFNFFERKKTKKILEKIEPATSRWAGERMWKLKNEHIICIGQHDDGTPTWLKGM